MQPQGNVSNRTNVRLSHRVIQATFLTLAPIPSLASLLAARLWATPPRAPVRPDQRAWLGKAERIDLDAARTRVATYTWGVGPAVLLVHGWGGHAGQLTSFVPGLVDAGYRVVAFDAPQHGATTGGTPSVPSFAEVSRAIAASVGGLHGVIAHSMGSSATAYAMSHGLEINRAVFLAPAATMTGAAERFAELVHLERRALDRMRKKMEKEFEISWEELDVVRAAGEMRSQLLVVHDEADREVPHADGAAIAGAWPAATLVTTAGLGHHRLLRDPGVVERAVNFVAGGVA